MQKKVNILSVVLIWIVCFAIGNANAQTPDLVVIEQGRIGVSSQCDGEKIRRAIIRIPQETPRAYSHTSIQVESKNGEWDYRVAYDINSKIVTVTAIADTNKDCGCFGPVCNKPGSNINILYTVFAQVNACDPDPEVPSENAVTANQYEEALERFNQSKECQLAVLGNKKKEELKKFHENIVRKVNAKIGERKSIHAVEIAKIQAAGKQVKRLMEEVTKTQPAVVDLGKLIYEMKNEFDRGTDFLSTTMRVAIQLDQLRSWKNNQKQINAYLLQNPRLKSLIDHRRSIGLSPESLPPKTIDTGFETEKWIYSLQRHKDYFHHNFQKVNERIESIKSQQVQLQIEHAKTLATISIENEVGIIALQSLLLQYKSKADEIYAKAVESQRDLQRMHDLNAKNLDSWICSSGLDPKFCRKTGFPQIANLTAPISAMKFLSSNHNIDYELKTSDLSRTCLTIEFYADYHSDLSPVPVRDGISFVHINGRPLSFTVDRNSIEYQNGKPIRSYINSCFSSGLLKLRLNKVELKFYYGDGKLLSGSSETTLYANHGTSHQRVICQERRAGSTSGARGCEGYMAMDLRELDPDLHNRIVSLQRESNALELELRKQNDELKRIQGKLELYLRLYVDKIPPDQIRALSSDLEETALLLEDLRFRAELEKEQVYNEVTEVFRQDGEPNVDSLLNSSYDLSNDKVLGPVVVPDFDLAEATINAHMLGNSEKNISADIQAAYSRTKSNIISEIQKSLDAGDFKRADAVLQSWKSTRAEILRRLKERKSGAMELDLFREMVVEVNEYIEKYFDQDGFYKAAQIPEDIKRSIVNAKNSNFAEAIRIAMNKNVQDRLNADQRATQISFYMMMRAYDDFLTFNSTLDKSNLAPEVRKDVESGLLAMAESGFRIGVSFTPMGKFIDFCELVTGRALCTPNGMELTATDRALAGVGIFIGSGLVLRKIAKSPIIKDSKVIGSLAEGFQSIILNAKANFAPTLESFEVLGSKILRLFVTDKSLSVAETLALVKSRLAKVELEYANLKWIDPAVENTRLRNLGLNVPAWKSSERIVSGVSKSEKVFVRFYSGKINNVDRWWIIEEQFVKGRTPEQIKNLLALPYVPDRYVKVVVPKNTKTYLGKLATNEYGGLEGMIQYYLPNYKSEWFKEVSEIGVVFRGLK